jgi:flagellar motor protein MotB
MSNHPFRSLFDLMVALVFILIGALVLQNGNTYDATPLQNELLLLHNAQLKETARKAGQKHPQYYRSLAELPKDDPCRAILRNNGSLSAEEWKKLQTHRTKMWQSLSPILNEMVRSETVITNIGQDKLHFETGMAVPIDPRQIQPILVDAYQKYKDGFRNFRVEGHTDNIPIHTSIYPSNWELSAARAIWVARQIQVYLAAHGASIGEKGVFVEAIGFGDSKPRVPNTSDANRAQNRRIEIVYEKK